MGTPIEVGRVQGASVFYTTATCSKSTTSISRSALIPSDFTPFIGDKVFCSTGELFNITAVNSDTITVSFLETAFITLNGSKTTSASFYAPTSAGTDGQVVKWDDTNKVPTWGEAGNSLPFTVALVDNGNGAFKIHISA